MRLDLSLCLEGMARGGLRPDFLEGLVDRLSEARDWLISGFREGKSGFGFLGLPGSDPSPVERVGAEVRERFDAVVLVGIGGSSLGPRTIFRALCHPYHNELSREERRAPRLYFAENPDPRSFCSLLEMLDLGRTCFVLVSKSGSTAETAAIAISVLGELKRALGSRCADNLVVVTDPERGPLRAFAREVGCRSLEVPPTVEGRFSVLSPVGLLPASVLGLDLRAMLLGAREVQELFESGPLDGVVFRMAAACYLMDVELRRPISVLMPYADALEAFGLWYRQLWAESLGKGGKGQTPVSALGAVDQHSQIQLYNEGPRDKYATLVLVEDLGRDWVMPDPNEGALSDFSYLFGRRMSELLLAEAEATALSMAAMGTPVLRLWINRVEERSLGALFQLYELVTGVCGYLYGVNPFDQPGVELGKRYTYAIMGRPGFEGLLPGR